MDERQVETPSFPMRTISIGMVAMILLLLASTFLTWRVGNQIRESMDQHAKVVSAAEKIDHYGRVLELSIHAVVRHADEEAAAEYRRVQPRLRSLLADLRARVENPDQAERAYDLDAVDLKLIAMEYEALDLAAQNRIDEARRIIESRRYDYLVDVYHQGVRSIETSAARYAESMRWQLGFNVWLIVAMSAASLVLVIVGWVALMMPTRRWGQKLEEARSQTERTAALLEEKQSDLEAANKQLFKQARTDLLTGLGTRLQFHEDIAKIWPSIEEGKASASLMICDIDFFKHYNDTFGHIAGDEVLRQVAAALTQAQRRGDRIYRMGGEEFLVLLDRCSAEDAKGCADRYRRAVEKLAIPHSKSPIGKVTISVGVASSGECAQATVQGWLSLADQALYEAKATGRNRVCTNLPLAA